MVDIPLTVIIPNRDRIDPNSKLTQFQMQSFVHQTVKDFKLIVIDGGSKNVEDLKAYFASIEFPKTTFMEHKIVGKWHKTLLNNMAIRKADTPHIMTTDADIFFAPKFFGRILPLLDPNKFIESRTMYWAGGIIKEIYDGVKNPFKDIDACKIGRIKKRTTPGACQCASKILWEKVRGYDERYLGWGSEDVDLWRRMCLVSKSVWVGESMEDIMLFHQPHDKFDPVEDMKDQYRNLNFYNNIKTHEANPDGWGGIN